MDNREPEQPEQDIFVAREEDARPNRYRQGYCIFCYQQRSLNNLRRHMDKCHKDKSKSK